MSVAAWTIVIIVTHDAPATFAPVVVAIPLPIPSVAAVIPPPVTVIVVIPRRALAPRRSSEKGQSRS
jgi:hypothetical protein